MTDKSYYERRAEAELDLAQAAVHPAAVRAHYEMAGHYLDRLFNHNAAAAHEGAPQANASTRTAEWPR